MVYLHVHALIQRPPRHDLLNPSDHIDQIDPQEPRYHFRFRRYLESSAERGGRREDTWVRKHVDVTVLTHGGVRRYTTCFESVPHGAATDDSAGVDDKEDLGLWDAVVDDLGGVEVVHTCGARTVSACRRSGRTHM